MLNGKMRQTGLKLVLSLALLAPGVYAASPADRASAQALEYSVVQNDSSESINGWAQEFDGTAVVWLAKDSGGVSQIFYKDISTGQQKQLTYSKSDKDSPDLSGNRVIWKDRREPDMENGDWDIYALDISTGQESKLNPVSGQNVDPVITGNYAVWYNRSTMGDMYLYDFVKDTVKKLEPTGQYPVVGKDTVVFLKPYENQLAMLNLFTGDSKVIVSPHSGSYISHFTFNGRFVLWSEVRRSDNATQMRMLDTADSSLVPHDLTDLTVKNRDYWVVSVGENYAAWLEDKNGITQITGADLAGKKAFPVTNGTQDQKSVGMSGDHIVLKSESGSLSFVTVTPIIPSSVGSTGPAPVEHQTKFQIGKSGGTVQSANGEVSVIVPAEAVEDSTWITIAKSNKVKSAANIQYAGDVWEIRSDRLFLKDVRVELSFNASSVAPDALRKLGIYWFDGSTGSWKREASRVDQSDDSRLVFSTTRLEGGTYAVLCKDVTFPDIQKHWAQHAIEILASREIVSGTGGNAFQPKNTLTRSEFSVMMMRALGISPEYPETPTFKDVNAGFWGYGWIEAAAKAEIITGYDGQFRPNEPLTREEMISMLVKGAGLGAEAENVSMAELTNYKDSSSISAWAMKNVALAVKRGFIQGSNGELTPRSNSSRAEAAAVIFKYMLIQKLL
jgi:beta propeller repeat protein